MGGQKSGRINTNPKRNPRRLTFTDPTFLILATILGSGCTAAFLVGNSLWPPLLIHYACVAGWLFFLGGAERLKG